MPEMSASGGVVVQMPLFSVPPRSAALHDVHAISIPARAFTGDFYFLHRAGERLWFALGDVAGKGLPAAVVMAMIQEELEQRIVSCARTACDPSVTMTRLHAFIKPLMAANKFATVIIGNLHDDGTVMIANAGHCPPMIARADGAIEEIASTGPVIGILPSSSWTTFETTLQRGESLVLYSDGVIEAQDFGVRRLAAALQGRDSKEIAENIERNVDHHTGGIREDDLTILVIKR
ncbi:MAG TPA: PP2C family protein-serine/threonine phosphatase [Thermoanaerobaculia bacterium]|nr:PP2C family protein-serine/threonine phosphatase [Thermoanaerobaculia bacterium]